MADRVQVRQFGPIIARHLERSSIAIPEEQGFKSSGYSLADPNLLTTFAAPTKELP